MGAGGVISSLATVRDDRLCFLGRHRRWRLDGGRFGLRRGGWCFGGRLVEHVGQFVEDGIARQAQLAQDFSHSAHDLRQAFGADYNQRDREDQSYFKKVQTSMTVRHAGQCDSMTLRGAGKFRASSPAPCQLIIIPDRGVNDA